jgi:hypothetical protein
MKFIEKEKKIGNHIAEENIYVCQNQTKQTKNLISKKTQKTEWNKSPSVTGKRYHYYSILERKNEIYEVIEKNHHHHKPELERNTRISIIINADFRRGC